MIELLGAQERLNALMVEHGLKQFEVAALICDQSRRPCATCTLRFWLNDPDKPSSRSCPGWALDVLEEAIQARFRAGLPVNASKVI